jgi:hypothetical protein
MAPRSEGAIMLAALDARHVVRGLQGRGLPPGEV